VSEGGESVKGSGREWSVRLTCPPTADHPASISNPFAFPNSYNLLSLCASQTQDGKGETNAEIGFRNDDEPRGNQGLDNVCICLCSALRESK
jgi:hypothetical protein